MPVRDKTATQSPIPRLLLTERRRVRKLKPKAKRAKAHRQAAINRLQPRLLHRPNSESLIKTVGLKAASPYGGRGFFSPSELPKFASAGSRFENCFSL